MTEDFLKMLETIEQGDFDAAITEFSLELCAMAPYKEPDGQQS